MGRRTEKKENDEVNKLVNDLSCHPRDVGSYQLTVNSSQCKTDSRHLGNEEKKKKTASYI